ncbi:hypothetical protein [Catenulispora rubra]|uniref:hypothetical protein n=1 Tax=Catenulispora rubra TaxID=280293 RepID=UPI0018928560|nr:hypothetical protein [Catenulispora rubra]
MTHRAAPGCPEPAGGQISPFNHSGNADALVWGLMAMPTMAFVLVPFIPGVRSIPRYVPVHRLIWRDHYRHRD